MGQLFIRGPYMDPSVLQEEIKGFGSANCCSHIYGFNKVDFVSYQLSLDGIRTFSF